MSKIKTIKVGDTVKIDTDQHRYHSFKVCDAPKGGRTVFNGPIHEKPFAFFICEAGVISNPPQPKKVFNATLAIFEEFIIEGYGAHRILEPKRRDNDSVRVERIEDGFSCID